MAEGVSFLPDHGWLLDRCTTDDPQRDDHRQMTGRIVSFVGPLPPPHGGVATLHQRLTVLLSESGIGTESWSTGGGRRVLVRRFRRAFVYLGIVFRCVVGPRRIVHFLSSSRGNFYVNSFLGRWAKGTGHKVILSVLGGGFSDMVEKDGTLTLAAIRMAARFDAIVASNDEIAERLGSLGVDRSRVHRIDNVLPNPRPEGEPGWLTLPVEFRRSTPRILATAAFSPEYGLDVLLKGFSGLLDSHPTAQLAILLAEKENPAYEREVKGLAERLGICEHVYFIKGLPEIISLYQNVDVVVRATRVDGDAVSVWEGLLEGKTVVASDTGHRPKQCLLFPVGDSNALTTALEEALADSGRANEAEAVRRQANTNLERLLTLYVSLGAERTA